MSYGNMPLEYQYLGQYHGFPNPVAGTPLAKVFGVPPPNNNQGKPLTKDGPGYGAQSYGAQSYGKGVQNFG